MKEAYRSPICEIIIIDNYDIITESSADVDVGGRGEEITLPEIDF